ncbi:hypothetical protein [Microlunatus parietis]|uniref:Uncharacterized protein n=1 Tax=Microlunatus parietis TaxID=682979 RepID=A0A7Y9ICS9_9ACTN|nr:hypothetical protein [Microlunatus parietis]NYE74350.1 hypothetical protein [Microlunatus parietis]
MSQAFELRTELSELAAVTDHATGDLQSFKQSMAERASGVFAAIGGTATNTDRAIAQLLQEAIRAADGAADARAAASHACADYANQL